MKRREKVVTLTIAALIPAAGIPLGVALGLQDGVILISLLAVALVAAVVQTMWESRRATRDRSA